MSITKILHISMLCVVFLMIAFVLTNTSVADNSIRAVTFSGTSNTDGTTNTGSGGSSGGGGGGGGGGSNEPTANIAINQVQYIQKVAKGTLDYDIDGPKTEVVGIKFNVLKTPAGEVEIRVQRLKERSTSTNSDPPGKTYSHLNIICGLQNEIDNVKIRFEVPKSWIESMSGKASDVKLVRYNSDKWNVLPTSVLEETDEVILFEAETPGFSAFAISLVEEDKNISINGGTVATAESIADETTSKESTQPDGMDDGKSKGLPALGFTMISLIIVVAGIIMRYKR